MGKQSKARANRRATRGSDPIEGMRESMRDLDQMIASGVVAPVPGAALRTAMAAALHAHDFLGLRGDALAPYVSAAADAAEVAMPGGPPRSVGPVRGEWHRVSSTAGMVPLAEVVKMFGNEALMARLRPIAATEGVAMHDIVVAKRDHGVLELAFYAPWKGGGFAPIFSVEYQR